MSTISTSAIQFSTLHAKKVARSEEREKKVVGKMPSSQIFSYLCYRHRAGLLTTVLLFSNLLWVMHYSVHP
jgi:hypothetical protein